VGVYIRPCGQVCRQQVRSDHSLNKRSDLLDGANREDGSKVMEMAIRIGTAQSNPAQGRRWNNVESIQIQQSALSVSTPLTPRPNQKAPAIAKTVPPPRVAKGIVNRSWCSFPPHQGPLFNQRQHDQRPASAQSTAVHPDRRLQGFDASRRAGGRQMKLQR
jgi:hypothetical protein